MTDRIPQDAKRVRLAYDDSEGRTVVTDIEVEPRYVVVVVPGGPTETWWRPTP